MNKLPKLFKQELVRKLGRNYPNVKELFENYVTVMSTLDLKAPKFSHDTGASRDTQPRNDANVNFIGEYKKLCILKSRSMYLTIFNNIELMNN